MPVLAAVAVSGLLVAVLVALLVAVLVYAVGVYVLHAPQPAVGLIAFVIFLLLILIALPGGAIT